MSWHSFIGPESVCIFAYNNLSMYASKGRDIYSSVTARQKKQPPKLSN